MAQQGIEEAKFCFFGGSLRVVMAGVVGFSFFSVFQVFLTIKGVIVAGGERNKGG